MVPQSSFTDVRLLPGPVLLEALDPFPAGAGAECVFVGRTRAEIHPQHGELRRLSYEAYAPMAQRVLGDLAAEAIQRWQCLAVRIHHALGEVPPGQASVLIQVACGHRDGAFEACRFLIDRLKMTAPIWKREVWADGATWSRGAPVAMDQPDLAPMESCD